MSQVCGLYLIHVVGGQASVRDSDTEGHVRQDQEERVPRAIPCWASCKETHSQTVTGT